MRTQRDFWLSSRCVFIKQQELDHAQILEHNAQDCCLSVPFRYLYPSFSCICAGLIQSEINATVQLARRLRIPFFCCSRLQVSGLDCNVLNIYMYVLNPVLILMQSYGISKDKRRALTCVRSTNHFYLQSSLVSENLPDLPFYCRLARVATPVVPQPSNHTLLIPESAHFWSLPLQPQAFPHTYTI